MSTLQNAVKNIPNMQSKAVVDACKEIASKLVPSVSMENYSDIIMAIADASFYRSEMLQREKGLNPPTDEQLTALVIETALYFGISIGLSSSGENHES